MSAASHWLPYTKDRLAGCLLRDPGKLNTQQQTVDTNLHGKLTGKWVALLGMGSKGHPQHEDLLWIELCWPDEGKVNIDESVVKWM